jgi:glutaconate CoA-transferase subunit A
LLGREYSVLRHLEMIRQGKRGLNMIAPISDASTDMLIGAGCVAEVTGAWVGSVSGGLGHNYRRAAEKNLPHAIRIHVQRLW